MDWTQSHSYISYSSTTLYLYPSLSLSLSLSLSRSLRFLLQLVGVLLEDISSKQVKVDMSEQQHTFYCQQLGTLLMCLIHIFKSGELNTISSAGDHTARLYGNS